MGGDSSFLGLVDNLPYDNEKLIGKAVSWFLQRQNPDAVEFARYNNGYQIQVFCDQDSADEAKDFWQEFIDPYIGGEQ